MLKKLLIALIALVIVCVLAAGCLWVFADYTWYAALNVPQVFAVTWLSRALTLLLFVVMTYALFATTLAAVRRRLRPRRSRAASWSMQAVAVLLALLASLQISSQWRIFRLALSGHAFGTAEPVTGLDVSFFVFTLPALERLVAWLLALVVLEAIWIAVLINYLPKSPDSPPVAGLIRRWVRPLLAALMAIVGCNLALSACAMLYDQSGLFPGLSATDARLRFPALLVSAAGAVIVAVFIWFSGRLGSAKRGSASPRYVATSARRVDAQPVIRLGKNTKLGKVERRVYRHKAALIAFAVWAVASVLALTVAPPLYQALAVSPNELTAEKPYMQHALDMTRASWQLDQTMSVDYAAAEQVSAEDSAAAAAELSRARIWTPSSLKQAFKQLETVRPYYQLSSIQPDRYVVNETTQEVLVTAREINPSGLTKGARTWVNRHLVYTHGYGISIASATESDAGGFPEFWVGDVPPVVAEVATADSTQATDTASLVTTEPRIYYGENTSDWALVGTTLDEFDHDEGSKNISTRYEGDGGVSIANPVTRLAWSLRLRSKDLLLSSYVTRDSQLLVTRKVASRVAKIAPWLTLDSKPYPALVEGRILWIIDGYTSSDHYPFAASASGKQGATNYLRNSVKAVVDAYTGAVTLYAFGQDPVRDAWAAIYPNTVVDASQTPAGLADHFRYPTKLFAAQAKVMRTYHIDSPEVFYNKEDLWGQYADGDGTLAPSYHLLSAPGADTADYSLVLPYSIPGKDNMIALVAANCDPADYGQLTAWLLPRERITLGPNQVLARIQQDPAIAPQIALWNQNGNTVVYGDMLVLPVADSIAYVQPIFLKAKSAAITELVGVALDYNDRIVMGSTVDDALAAAGALSGDAAALSDTVTDTAAAGQTVPGD
ncbi:MAG: UPF0182 family protein [Actinomycetes bacterium]|jgi:uncharacterized membrane protein (UPF0182 family)|nr:UPF0182 family protein [Actinomycetes bacterium]